MSDIQDHHNQQTQQQPASNRLKLKSSTMTVGITAGAEDAKYHVKYKELKRKVKDIEESNEKLLFKVEQAKQSIRRMKMERAILYERLNGSTPSPAGHDRPPPSHPHQHGGHHPQQHPGHPAHQGITPLNRQSSHIHDNDVPMQDIHPRGSRQGGPPPHSASSLNDPNQPPNVTSNQIPPPSSIHSPRRIGSSSASVSSADPNRHHGGPPIPGQQQHAGAPLPPPGSAGSGGMPYDGPPGSHSRTGFNSHSTTSPAMHHAHASSSHHSRTRSHSSSHSRPHMSTSQSQHQPPPPPPGPSHRSAAGVPHPAYSESIYGPSPNAPAPLHSPPLSERDLRDREREREPHRDRDRERDRDGVRERDRENRERERDRDGRSRRAHSGAGNEVYHPGYDYGSSPRMAGDAHLSPYERGGPLPAPPGANREPPMMHMSASPRGAHAHPTRIHAHQRVGPGAHIQRDDVHERRGGDLDWERDLRERERRDRDRERDKREDKDYPPSSSYHLSPHSTHRSHRERDRDYDAPHHLREHPNYYPDSPYVASDRGPPAGPSYSAPSHSHRSATPNSGSGQDRDAPSRPDSRTGYYSRDPGHSSHPPVTTSPRSAHMGASGGRSTFRLRTSQAPHDDPEFNFHGGREERDRLAGARTPANGASSVSPAPPPGVPQPTNSATGSGTSTPLTGGHRPPKRSRNDMDVDSEPETGLGADGRGSGAAMPRDGERNSKRYHRDSRRDLDEPSTSGK
ncbi:hypothetical protein CVT24_011486 [Panaeolus cyanescens]|uniref:INO80 complex subunit F domain-containing protein n=1 Tax=Panaeolus cyanescens TaxID=181874 RepID=A0A409VGL8_9AGAR|nr:hypothetical protein CVT24_011486 [Panaeolus cyanescens]